LSIRTTLVLLTCVVMLPLLATVGLLSYRSAQIAKEITHRAVLDAAHTRAQAVGMEIDQLRDLLLASAQRPLVRALDPRRCDPLMSELRGIDPRISVLGLRTAAGEPVCLSRPAGRSGPPAPADSPWVREALAVQGFHVGGPFIGAISGDWVVPLSAPVRDPAGNRTGALIATLPLEAVDQLMVKGRPIEGAVVLLVDQSGTALFRSADIVHWRGRPAFSAVPPLGATRTATGLDGVERLYASAAVPRTRWRVLVGQPAAIVSETVRRQIVESMLLWALVAVLACALALAAARSIGRRIERLRALVRAAGAGHIELPVPAGGPAEIAELAEEFNRVLAARRQSEGELRAMAQRLVTLQDKDRRDIARELHDRVGQNLSALGINLERLRGDSTGRVSARRVAECASLVEATGIVIQDVLTELKPPMLASYGLLEALRWHGREFSRRTGIEVQVEGPAGEGRLPPEIEMALFRVAQAALNNVAQHAQAKNVRVSLASAGARTRFEIRDDGVGFDAVRALASGRWGLTAIRERAEAIGGSLRIESAAGSGTRIVVEAEGA
jgi:signal transduction histidine kinase